MKACKMEIKYLFLVVTLLIEVHGQRKHQLERLGSYRVSPQYITLSGFSSGGTFAQQFFISHSSLIYGIAVFSHTYYRCGPGTGIQEDYDNACTTIGQTQRTYSPVQEYDVNKVFRDIEEYTARGLIDSPRQLKNKPLYVYSGSRNYLFTTDQQLRIVEVFEPYISNPTAIQSIVQEANATFPTNRKDYPACIAPPSDLALSYCGFSGSFQSLRFLLGPNAIKSSTSERLQPLIVFDQSEFFYGIDSPENRHDMDAVGYLYVPTICRTGHECLLHFYFHGCTVGREFVGVEHIRNSGYLEVAEANGIIMVFPQVLSSAQNEIGCWDTYGFTGPLYATKKGAQITVVRNMIARILKQDGYQEIVKEQPHNELFPVGQGQSPQPETPFGNGHNSESSSPFAHYYSQFSQTFPGRENFNLIPGPLGANVQQQVRQEETDPDATPVLRPLRPAAASGFNPRRGPSATEQLYNIFGEVLRFV